MADFEELNFFFAIVLPKENAQNWMSSSVLQQVKCEVPCHPVGQMPHFFCIISQVFVSFPQFQQHFSSHVLSIILAIEQRHRSRYSNLPQFCYQRYVFQTFHTYTTKKERKRYAKSPLFSKIFFPAILLSKTRARMCCFPSSGATDKPCGVCTVANPKTCC